jgi:hypothetical protein
MTEEIDNLLDYLQRAGLNTISINSPAWKLMHKIKKVSSVAKSTQGTNSMKLGNGQKMTVGKLVEHKTVPKLGLGLVVAESRNHPNYWIVKWCDPRYHDVGQMGIHADFLKIM